MLPYLARYMGHASIESSYYYIHTSPDFMHAYAHITAASQSRCRRSGSMKRDPATRAPDFYRFARDYLHTYLPTVARRSPNTIEAYRISLECLLDYLAEDRHVERAHVNFDHLDRPHLKGWLAWMADQQHYAPRTIALRLTAVKAFLTYCCAETSPSSR
jgi:integrase